MDKGKRPRRHTDRLIDRAGERRVLDQLLSAVHGGEGRVLVVRGEAGVGKTALLEYLQRRATGCRVIRGAGVQSEMELPFAGLHQLLSPVLDRLVSLPDPQRDALRAVFGISAGPAPDRFLVGVAVLGLLTEMAGQRPLVCLVDDAQWLDQCSAQALEFVARRLVADPIALVFASRDLDGELAKLPELTVEGLSAEYAQALLESVVTGTLDVRVRDQILAETQGNPLALMELTRDLSAARLAGGFGLPSAGSLAGRIEEAFQRRLDELPVQARRLLRLAAADPTGDPTLLRQASDRLGIPAQAATWAADARLAEFGTRVRFRHPLIRSAAYQSASWPERQEVHQALADVTDPVTDPDRRAWHRAQAAAAPDEDIAAELERSAGRAQARGGLAAAAAFLERAMLLTPDRARRAGRALAAAHAKLGAGALDAVPELVGAAESEPLNEQQRASADLVRARLAFAARRGSEAPPLLLRAAKRLESSDIKLARTVYMDALTAACFAGRLAVPGGSLLDVASAAGTAPSQPSPRPSDLILDGLAVHFNQGYATAAPLMREALRVFDRDHADLGVRELTMGFVAAEQIWDDEGTIRIADEWATVTRQAGALSDLPLALFSRTYAHLLAGELAAATSVVEEMQAAIEATGSDMAPYGALGLAAMRGNQADTAVLIEAMLREAPERGEGLAISATGWADAVLNNGLGRYDVALAAAQRSAEVDYELGFANWAFAELVEAAVRNGTSGAAANAYRRLTEQASAAGTDWILGLEARSHALLTDDSEAGRLHRAAIEYLGRTRARPDLARAHLLYGESLRRDRRSGAAREQLRIALAMLDEMGMAAFAERARRELRATGDTVVAHAVRVPQGGTALTSQEEQVAHLARDGLSNPEIAARLFISVRTVQYHLSKVFGKLGIKSRAELHMVLPGDQSLARHAGPSALAQASG